MENSNMIKVNKRQNKAVLTDYELERLASIYLQLRINPTFQKMTSDFQAFVNEYLARELKQFDSIPHIKYERP